jgi:hypothetical protein
MKQMSIIYENRNKNELITKKYVVVNVFVKNKNIFQEISLVN